METRFTKREFARTQTSLLTKSMLIAGAFFVLIGLGSWGFGELFYANRGGMNWNVWLPIMMLVMFAGMLISMLWTKVMWQGKAGFTTVLIYAMYVICESLAFGYLFALARASGIDYIWVSFVVAGGVFAICALIAKAMSAKGIFTLGKMIGAAAIAMAVMMFVALITMIVWMATNNWAWGQTTDLLFAIMMFVMAFVTAAYIIIDIWSISRTEEFVNYVGEETNSAVVWFTGYRLLVDLLNLVLIIIWLMIRLFKNR